MQVEINDVQGKALSYLIAKAIWPEKEFPAWWFIDRPDGFYLPSLDEDTGNPVDGFYPQSDWGLSGPFLSKHDIFPFKCSGNDYGAHLPEYVEHAGKQVRFETFGPSPLVAAWRCFVASRLGQYSGCCIMVEVPDEFSEES